MRQLEGLRSRLAKSDPSRYPDDNSYRRERRRSLALISELESELSMLDCPGEYDELPAAVVADELGLTCAQVRGLIRLGEIAAGGSPAHERISRGELERVALVGGRELSRLGEEDPAEIFERAIPHLRGGDLAAAERAYRRLEARLSWRGPHAPAYLVGLELARGDLEGALASVRLILEYEDLARRVLATAYLARVLRETGLKDEGARALRVHLLALAEGAAANVARPAGHRPRRSKAVGQGALERQAEYLTAAVMSVLRKRGLSEGPHTAGAPHGQGGAFRAIRDAIYTALYAEAIYGESIALRVYTGATADTVREDDAPTQPSDDLAEEAGRRRRRGRR